MIDKLHLQSLKNDLLGELYFDDLHRKIYATDASVYRKVPLAVAYPKNKQDIQKLIAFVWKERLLGLKRMLAMLNREFTNQSSFSLFRENIENATISIILRIF